MCHSKKKKKKKTRKNYLGSTVTLSKNIVMYSVCQCISMQNKFRWKFKNNEYFKFKYNLILIETKDIPTQRVANNVLEEQNSCNVFMVDFSLFIGVYLLYYTR